MESLWIIFFIVRLLVLCGMFSSIDLSCLGLCLGKLSTCMLVSGLLATLEMLLCGKWYFRAFCGVFEGKGVTLIFHIRDAHEC